MKRYMYYVGSPFTNRDGRTTTVELDPTKEEIIKSAIGLQWHDMRDPRRPAWRLIWEVK